MIIKTAKFLRSESGISKNYSGFNVPEIAVVGRSNVGKSSFINMLANNFKLAKTSSTPGRTKLVNYFMFNDSFVLVDLPGYGFAKTSQSEKDTWENMITSYFADSNFLAGIILLVDSRIVPTEKDEQMLNYLMSYNIPTIVVGTKLDKLKKSQMEKSLIDISSKLKIGKNDIILTSSETRANKDKVLAKIEQLITANKEGQNEDLGD